MILGGDIGGTKTHLALFEEKDKKLTSIFDKKYPSQEHKSLCEIVEDFIKEHKDPIHKACFGIAGPVINGSVKTTNLPWDVTIEHLKTALPQSNIKLINDLEANAWGIDALEEKDLAVLQKGRSQTRGNRALISAGTGLGQAGIYFDGEKYHPFATEAGHADFSPRNDKEMALLKYLTKPFGHVSYERVLSGHGLYNIYQFLCEYHKKRPSNDIAAEIQNGDPAILISKHALDQTDPLCQEALEMMISFYGAEAGNCALRYMSYSGLYIGGGIAPKVIHLLKKPLFLEAFLSKGRFRSLLENIPIQVILNDQTALLGAGLCALTLK